MPVRTATSLMVSSAGSKFGITNLHLRIAGWAEGYPTAHAPTRGGAQVRRGGTMSGVEQSVEVEVPVRTAYDQWTQFEQFPRFMEGVEEVRQVDDTHLHWRTKVAGREQEFDAEITEQTPDQRIAWTSQAGREHAGVVTFHRLDEGRTKVMLQMDAEPDGAVEKAGDALGLL